MKQTNKNGTSIETLKQMTIGQIKKLSKPDWNKLSEADQNEILAGANKYNLNGDL